MGEVMDPNGYPETLNLEANATVHRAVATKHHRYFFGSIYFRARKSERECITTRVLIPYR